MEYMEFSNNVKAATAAKKVVDDFAVAQTDGVRFCPRCGRWTVKDELCTNALSRHVHVYICDDCGTDEAIREFYKNDLPLSEWAIAKLYAEKAERV